ncbi:MAG: ferredoxin [Elusimicrobia bacterium RIFOXYB2_FULL_48_7]|nr:MAG: ferredoxin [Elusimicrobia bacterium RIFOXYB2_FULL_48_7]
MLVKVNQEKCTGCGKCADVCMVNAIKIEKGKAVINDNCVECGICLNTCAVKALSIERG